MTTTKLCLVAILAALLMSCESRPAAHTTTGVAASAASLDSVALAAAVASAAQFTADLSEARQAVLRQATLPADTSAPLIPKPTKTKLLRHPAQLPPGFSRSRRYVGTLGGQPVVLELTGEQASQYGGGYKQLYRRGHYYFKWGGQERELVSTGFHPGQPMLFIESIISYLPDAEETDDSARITGTWQTRQPLGAVLTGTWTDKKTRRTTSFELHEDYSGAVQYEEVYAEIQAKDSCRVQGQMGFYDGPRYAAWWSLHLLGPDTLRPASRRMQCLLPQQVQQQLAALLTQTDCGGHAYGISKNKQVNYNGDGLWSWTDITSYETDATYPTEHAEEHICDLATGKEYRIADWLRPDKLPKVRQLATACLLATTQNGPAGIGFAADAYGLEKPPCLLKKLPVFLLSNAGIGFRLGEDFGFPHVSHKRFINIPYAAIAPYVLPGTPLARLVAARARPGR